MESVEVNGTGFYRPTAVPVTQPIVSSVDPNQRKTSTGFIILPSTTRILKEGTLILFLYAISLRCMYPA